MGSGGTEWEVNDDGTFERMNQKTLFIGTGAQINALSTTYAGQKAFCTTSSTAGIGFSAGKTYRRNEGDSAWELDSNSTTNALVVAHSTTIGDYTNPSSATATSTASDVTLGTVGGTAGNQELSAGNVWAEKLTGLTPGDRFSHVGINFQAQASNVRVKVYQDDGGSGYPSTLLAESDSLSPGGTGWKDIPLNDLAVVPASGNVWIGMESAGAGNNVYRNTSGTIANTQYIPRSYGAGPDPWSSGTAGTLQWNFRLRQVYATTSAVDGQKGSYWKSGSVANPAIYGDMGSNVDNAEIVIMLSSETTETEIKIRTSTTTSFSDSDNVRTVTLSNLTEDDYNYIRFNVRNARYVQVYGSSGSTVVLALAMGVLVKTSAELIAEHDHYEISSSDTSIGLVG